MSCVDDYLDRFSGCEGMAAFIYNGESYSYGWLRKQIIDYIGQLGGKGVSNKVLGLRGDYSPYVISAFIAAASLDNVIVPITQTCEDERAQKHGEIANIQASVHIDAKSDERELAIKASDRAVTNALLLEYMELKQAGLILFSSGTSGEPKAILMDLRKLFKQHLNKKSRMVSIPFLNIDHIGGINTFLSQLSACGTMVIIKERTAASICRAIDKHKVELLPVTPSFLNLLLISQEYKNYCMDSVKLITYGTEVMPEHTLKEANKAFGNVKFKQTYGMTETGILPSKSESEGSLWVKLGGDNCKTKVVGDTLHVKSELNMVGYLNYASPIDGDGWVNTGDLVEVKGDYYKILGRNSDIINVGGLKVFPQEVENVILEMPEVEDVLAMGEPNYLFGKVVVAKIKLKETGKEHSIEHGKEHGIEHGIEHGKEHGYSEKDFKRKVAAHCRQKLDEYKVPVRITLVEHDLHTERYKKIRIGET